MTQKIPLGPYLIRLSLVTAGLLLIPLIAMQFTSEVDWSFSDFALSGTLIIGTGLAYKLITRKSGELIYRVATGIACATGFLLIWVNGAVGIIGSEANTVNLWFFVVPLIGLIGAFISRFQPGGMTYALFATAAAQALIATIAIVGEHYQPPTGSVEEIMGINGFFMILWSIAALMFRYVSRNSSEGELKTV